MVQIFEAGDTSLIPGRTLDWNGSGIPFDGLVPQCKIGSIVANEWCVASQISSLSLSMDKLTEGRPINMHMYTK